MSAGTEVVITDLEMTARPGYDRPSAPAGPPLALMRAEDPPAWYFLSLYRAVGGPHQWTDWLRRPRDEVEAFVRAPDIALYTLMRSGWPAGFFMLGGGGETCELVYFGLVPEAQGAGLGSYLLRTAIHLGWDRPGTTRMIVDTCTLDHPRALGLYQAAGFRPVRQRTEHRVLA